MATPVRLAKRLAELVSCSRREAELYIAGGWVSVDGQVVEEPQFMVLEQKVELHPQAVPLPVAPVTILCHWPAEVLPDAEAVQRLICAATRAADDHSNIRLLRQHFFKLSPCAPLEPHASGLTVLTQDFRVRRKLTEDAGTIEQEYVVEVAGEPIADGLKLLNHGLSYNGKPLPPVKVSWQNENRLRFALKGVQPGQITHMCEAVGLRVGSMKRLRIGRVPMSGLAAGQWRYLKTYERF